MARAALKIADILDRHGDDHLRRHAGHLSLGQLKVISAIRTCRTATLSGHVARCTDCAHTAISYNSCRNRHCPKCQGAAARKWLAEREADLLLVPYFHVVFTLPAPIAAIAFTNKAAVYDLLFKAAAKTVTTVAADPKHLGARVGLTAVLHTWGSALTHHPHVHMIVPGGGLSPGGLRWIACRPGFFLPVRVLSRLFRRLFLDGLLALHGAGRLAFFGEASDWPTVTPSRPTSRPCARPNGWSTPSAPIGGPEAVLAFVDHYSGIHFDLVIDDDVTDIVAAGFDAGIRSGEMVHKDMIAIRLTPDLHMRVVGAPSYFERRTRPVTPDDLGEHRCVAYRWSKTGALQRWRFEGPRGPFDVQVEPHVDVNETDLLLTAALNGAGLACLPEDLVSPHIANGCLVEVLATWCRPVDGFHLYYPRKPLLPVALRTFVDFLGTSGGQLAF